MIKKLIGSLVLADNAGNYRGTIECAVLKYYVSDWDIHVFTWPGPSRGSPVGPDLSVLALSLFLSLLSVDPFLDGLIRTSIRSEYLTSYII